VNPLALILKPQSPAEVYRELVNQYRNHKKLQRERQLRKLEEEEAKARGEAVKRPERGPRGSKKKPSPLIYAPSDPFSGTSTQIE
jgi:hypothetical protein